MYVSWSVDLHRPSLPRAQISSPWMLPAHADKSGYRRQAWSASVHPNLIHHGTALCIPSLNRRSTLSRRRRIPCRGRCFRCCQVTVANAVTKAPILSARKRAPADGIRWTSFCTVHPCCLRLCNLCRMAAIQHRKPILRAATRQRRVALPRQLSDYRVIVAPGRTVVRSVLASIPAGLHSRMCTRRTGEEKVSCQSSMLFGLTTLLRN